MPDRERCKHTLEHAEWRVEHVQALLAMHRTMPFRTDEWRQKELEYLKRLAAEESALAKLRGWSGQRLAGR